MTSSVWDKCFLDAEIQSKLEIVQRTAVCYNEYKNINERSKAEPDGDDKTNQHDSMVKNLHTSITGTEESCKESLEILESILTTLNEVEHAYEDVTGRTNSLIRNCEDLLEQQHSLQQTVEILKNLLEPFDDIEDVAKLLGIPFDSHQYSTRIVNSSDSYMGNNIDPRSPEFQNILKKLSGAIKFLRKRSDIKDYDKYQNWLEKLKNRATSLVGRAMRDMLEKASKSCQELYAQKIFKTGGKITADDQPIESSPVYQKFRSLSYRMRELGFLLQKGSFREAFLHPVHLPKHNNSDFLKSSSNYLITRSSSHQKIKLNKLDPGLSSLTDDHPVISEVKQSYVMLRHDLLLNFIKDTWLSGLLAAHSGRNLGSIGNGQDPPVVKLTNSGVSITAAVDQMKGHKKDPKSPLTPNNNNTILVSLTTSVRHAYNTLLRVTQLEQQLFDSLFKLSDEEDEVEDKNPSISNKSPLSPLNSMRSMSIDLDNNLHDRQLSEDNVEVLSIIETISNTTRDFLRPLIIHESDVDELCRVISALSEDVRSQMLIMPVPKLLLRQLLRGLDATVNDAKERLTYCAEMKLRQEVQLFEPLPSQLAYPDILETYAEQLQTEKSNKNQSENNETQGPDVYSTWYPPMRSTLSLLSKLYGVVDLKVFEDFARRGIQLCVRSLENATGRVKRSRAPIHSDLFLVRHLLILREQLVPFEIRLQKTEKSLDFTPSSSIFAQFAQSTNTSSFMNFDFANNFLQLAYTGLLPKMQETEIDAKKDLDLVLKSSCHSLKQSALKMLLGAMDGFLAKVTAFAGEIPTSATEQNPDNKSISETLAINQPIQLSSQISETLKSQAFMRAERIKEMLESVQTVLIQRVPDLKAIMKLYIENNTARTILLKPVLQDFEICKQKMECIISSCIDPGQPRRDLENLLHNIVITIVTELSNA